MRVWLKGNLVMKNDYMLDMVESFGKNLGKMFFDEKEEIEPIVIENLSDKDIMKVILQKLIYEGKFNEAENTLFEFLDKNKSNEVKEVGEWFYNELSLKSDEALEKASFSRDEVESGIKEFIKNFSD